jgi:hypothetical protein
MRLHIPVRIRRGVPVLAVLVAVAAPTAALAGQVTRPQAQRTAKVAASRFLQRSGIDYPPRAWRAACRRRAAGGWTCEVGTFGQCSGVVTVTGTSARPRARKVSVSCFE